ncbi:hypothetical protein L0Y65_00195 [Candidatus Micrarchaeota archaeon]|nr:hypothetical protein [Candidatus Micrarchaeota archaeon]
MKGQSSLELLATVGVVVAFTVPVLFLLLSVSSIGYEDTAKAQADATSRTIADAMNTIYAQGPGVQREVLVNVPPSTQSIRASANEVVVSIRTSGGTFDAASPTIAKIGSGSMTVTGRTGLIKLVIRTNNRGEVELIDPTAP